MDEHKKGFTCGAVWAMATLIGMNEEGHAELLWHESGFTSEDLALCDAYDTDRIRKYLKEWEKSRA